MSTWQSSPEAAAPLALNPSAIDMAGAPAMNLAAPAMTA